MVVKFQFSHLYRYTWEQVTDTHLTKYPTKREPNVKGIEIIEKSEDLNEPTYLKYIVTCLNVLPNILRKVEALNTDYVCYEEECWVFREKRLMKVRSRNLSLSQYAQMTETSTFREADLNPKWTQFEQEGRITICGLGPANWLIERFIQTFFEKGMKKSVKLVEDILEERSRTKYAQL